MPKYKLTRRFLSKERLWPVGTVLEFDEGLQPKTAVRVKDGLAAEESIPTVDPTDPDIYIETPSAEIVDAEAGDTLASLSKKGK